MKTRAPSRSKSWFKLHYGIHQAMSSVGKNRVYFITWYAFFTPARGQLFINSVTSYAYDAANAIDDNNYATVLQSFLSTSSLQVAHAYKTKVSGHKHLILATTKTWFLHSVASILVSVD